MKPIQIVVYSLIIALFALFLKWMEYRFWMRGHTTEIYIGAVAALFLGLGLWMGWRWSPSNQQDSKSESPPVGPEKVRQLGLSQREMEVLMLMAEGYSNQEIADKLYVSLSTVKSHASNLYSKLDVRRRTQAVSKAQELGILS